MKTRAFAIVAVLLGVTLSLPQAASGAPRHHGPQATSASDPVLTWNATAADAALNAIVRRSEPYVFDAGVWPHASPEAAVAAAAHDVLVPVLGELPAIFPPAAAIGLVEQRYVAALATIPAGAAKDKGVAIGQA